MDITEFVQKVQTIDKGPDRDLLVRIVDILYEYQIAKEKKIPLPEENDKDLDEIFEQMMNNPGGELYNTCYKKLVCLVKEEMAALFEYAEIFLRLMASDPGKANMRWAFDKLMKEKGKDLEDDNSH